MLDTTNGALADEFASKVASAAASTGEQIPQRVACPIPHCDARAWRMPDGNTYCEAIGGVPVLPEPQPVAAVPQRVEYPGYDA